MAESALISLLPMFFSAFLAATVLPFSSEAILAGLYSAGGASALALWTVASVGNVLGALLNWFLGGFCLHWRDHRWFPFSPQQLTKAETWFGRYGVWTLLLAWVPLIGDPLTFAAGLLRVPLWIFLVLVTIGKAGRYAAILWVTDGVM